MTQIITSYSPKTAGSTIFCLNAALLHQWENPLLKVACLQLAEFPDLEIYAGQENIKNLGDLIPFLDSGEFDPSLLDIIKKNIGIDLFFSPNNKTLKKFNLENFQKIWDLFLSSYDVLYIDISHGVPFEIQNFLQNQAQKNILVGTIDPLSLKSILDFSESCFLEKKSINFVINQCPQGQENYIRKKLASKDISLLGILPSETKFMWSQVYEGFPIVNHKKSKFMKSLQPIMKKII